MTYLGGSEVFCVLLAAGGGEEDDVVDGLYELQLNHTLDQQALEQLLVRHRLWN